MGLSGQDSRPPSVTGLNVFLFFIFYFNFCFFLPFLWMTRVHTHLMLFWFRFQLNSQWISLRRIYAERRIEWKKMLGDHFTSKWLFASVSVSVFQLIVIYSLVGATTYVQMRRWCDVQNSQMSWCWPTTLQISYSNDIRCSGFMQTKTTFTLITMHASATIPIHTRSRLYFHLFQNVNWFLISYLLAHLENDPHLCSLKFVNGRFD